jgi:ATP-dependent DNA helicase RecQ
MPPATPARAPLSLEQALGRHFGFTSFRPGQRELTVAVLAGRDALGVLPTGGGKSLTYQLPALLLPGLTVVVSPLIALMKDQVDAFNRRGKALAVAIHSNLTPREATAGLERVHAGEAALLYVAPERAETPEFRARLVALQPKLLVIDEAHCVSMWGHDFRPSYLALKELADGLRPAPVLALTATATPATRRDIVQRLGLREPLIHVASFDRPNLRFEVHPCDPDEKLRRLRRILKDLAGLGSQIVYVGRRKDAEEIAEDLEHEGIGSVAYHAGLVAARRKAAQESWLAGKKPVAVATIAFGMGIDKPDVRAVIHYQHPASLESYYQEAGRAGRDGLPARCIVLFSAKDSSLANWFIRNRYPDRARVFSLLKDISPGGTPPEELKLLGDSAMSDEQRNVALLALLAQGLVRRGEAGSYLRAGELPDPARISLKAMYDRKDGDYRRLEAMLGYAREEHCHRAVLLRYFGEEVPAGRRCGNCSACSGGTAHTGHRALNDEIARVLVLNRAMLEAAGPLTSLQLAQFVHGSSSERLPQGWRALTGYASLPHVPLKKLTAAAAEVLNALPGALASTRAPAAETIRGRTGRLVCPRMVSERPRAAGEGKRASAAPSAAPSADTFWHSRDRAFTRAELEAHRVPRRHGLLILQLAAARPGLLAPSMVVAILRGGAQSARSRTPELGALPQWNALPAGGYDELLKDVLAMWAKGYLGLAGDSRKKLELTPKGAAILEKSAVRSSGLRRPS